MVDVSEVNIEQRYAGFLQLAMAMVDAQAGMPVPDGCGWQVDRQALVKQFTFHLHAIHALSAGSTLVIRGARAQYLDHGSIKVLARAAVEAYIVFAYIFGDTRDDVNRYRHLTWVFGGLMDRQKHTATLEESRQKQATERVQVDQIRSEIERDPLFLQLAEKSRKVLMKKADWSMGLQWHELAVAVGFNEQYFRNMYSYLCGYSHSSYAAALQVRDARSYEVQHQLAKSILGMLVTVMAHFLTRYAAMFESAARLLSESPERHWVERFRFTAADLEAFYKSHS